jgi:carboxypeptidase D
MLLRFMNTDFLSAAGGAAQVPSRIGSETEAIVGPIHANGTALAPSAPGGGGVLSSEPLDASLEVEAVGSGAEAVRQAYYNAGSAALLVLLVLACAAIFLCLRARTRRDGSGGVGGDMLPLEDARRPTSGTAGRSRRRHRKGALSLASTVSEGPHELDELVVDRPEDDEDDDEDDDRPKYTPRGQPKSVPRNEELFSVCVGTPLRA